MQTGKTGSTGLPTIRNGPWPRLQYMLRRFTARAASVVAYPAAVTSTDDCAAAGAVQDACSAPNRAATESWPRYPVSPLEDAPIRYLALGTPSDRKAFTVAIRAFALAGRWGDHLTLIGYGRHRRALEKWSVALRTEAVVTFAEPYGQHVPNIGAYDVAIILSRPDKSQISLILEALSHALRIILMGQDTDTAEIFRARGLSVSVAAGDVLALSHAMLTTITADEGDLNSISSYYNKTL